MNNILTNDWGMALGFITIIALMLFLAEMLMKRLEVHPNTTRRIVHILVGVLVAVAPFLFEKVTAVLAISAVFAIVNFLAIKGAKLDGIHAAKRKSYGTVYFPVSFALLSIWFWDRDPAILISAMYIMAFGDPIVSWVGESSRKRLEYRIWYDVKSLQGSIAMFMVSYITAFTSIQIYKSVFSTAPDFSETAIASFFL